MDEHEEINYKTLRRLQQAEQNASLLTKITSTFYQDLSLYMKNLQHSVELEKNPQKLKLFSDEAQNTKKIAHSIYELREKKIVQAALATARGGVPDLKHMLDSEKKLYTALVAQITASRKEIFEEPTTHQKQKQPPSLPEDEQQKRHPNTHPIVRVLENTPEFIGTDEKTYHLQKEDVLSLPPDMTPPLLKKGVIKQVK